MNKWLYAIATMVGVCMGASNVHAHNGEPKCAHSNGVPKKIAAKTTMADLAEDHYNIRHLDMRLNVTDTDVYIEGDVRTTASVVAASMSEYVFELTSSMTIDSAQINGVTLPVTGSGSVRRIALSTPLTAGSTFVARVVYHGMPPTGAGFFNGVTHAVSGGGTHMMYTVSDPWVALNWWPCKQSVLDQADSVDMYIKVPAGVTDGSNGVLISVDETSSPGYSIYHWKTRYPIDYYLISLAVAKYGEYKHYQRFSDVPTDSVLIQNFLMDTATFVPAHKAKFDSVGLMLDYFSGLYGRYPFWREKYGMCFTNLGGGMEHQTMTTIGVTNTTTIAHELAHQWWGDHVTYKTWGDMWLSEGFATFSEQLFIAHYWGSDAARAHRQGQLSAATARVCSKVYVDDTTTSDSLFTVSQYQKPAIIINTLRYMAPEDSLFFKVLRTYQTMHSFGNASTADLKSIAESIYGFSLDTFFNQWIYGRGYPLYKVRWNQIGSRVVVKLMQSTSCPSATPHFSTPVEIHLKAGSIDTFVKVYNSLDTQDYYIDWAQTVTGVALNTNVWTLLRPNGITKDATLGTGMIEGSMPAISPNPSDHYWQIDNVATGTQLLLTDLSGKVLWEGVAKNGSAQVSAQELAAGLYLLRLQGSSAATLKLVRL